MESTDGGDLTIAELIAQSIGWIALGSGIAILMLLVGAIIVARKAGYSHWLGVIAVLVPGAMPIMFLLFALVKWPLLRERDKAIELLEAKGVSAEEITGLLKEERQRQKDQAKAAAQLEKQRAKEQGKPKE